MSRKGSIQHATERLADYGRWVLPMLLDAIHGEKRLPCLCGTEPYDNGNECPICACYIIREDIEPYRKVIRKAFKNRQLRKRRKPHA